MEEDAAPYKTYQLCDPKQKFAILIHGWKENCDTEWMNWMVSSTYCLIDFLGAVLSNFFNFYLQISPNFEADASCAWTSEDTL